MKRGDLQQDDWIKLNSQKLDALLAPGKAVLIFATGHKDNKPDDPFHASQLGAYDHVAVAWKDEAGIIHFREVRQGDEAIKGEYGEQLGPTFGSKSTSGTPEELFLDYAKVDVIPLQLAPGALKTFVEKIVTLFKPGMTYSFGENGNICSSPIFNALLTIPEFKEAFEDENPGTFRPPGGDITLNIVRPDDLASFSIYLLALSNKATPDNGDVVFRLSGYDLRLAAEDVVNAISVWASELGEERPQLKQVLQVAEEALRAQAHVRPDDPDLPAGEDSHVRLDNPDLPTGEDSHVRPDNPDLPWRPSVRGHEVPEGGEGMPRHPKWGGHPRP
jgi:hypothetical protein